MVIEFETLGSGVTPAVNSEAEEVNISSLGDLFMGSL